MSTRFRSIATAGVLAVLAFGLYASRIGTLPLSPAEIEVVAQADAVGSIAIGFPLFFHVGDEHWLQPLAVYATALTRLATSSDLAGRLAAAVTGAVNVALMFVLCQRLLASTPAATGAALLLTLTPAHIVTATTGIDAIYPLPFVLAWLISLTIYFDSRERRFAAAGAFALGVGVYANPSAPLTMAFLLAVTLVAICRSGRRDAASLAIPAAAFGLPLVVAGAWLVANPSAYPDTLGRWAIHAAHLRSPIDLAKALVNWNTLGTRASLYWGFFDPSWLFFNGPPAPASPLRGLAPFLFATGLALVAGVSQRLRGAWSPVTLLLLAGLAVAPLAASTFGEAHAVVNAMVVVPLVVVLAAGGVAGWVARDDSWRWLGWSMIAILTIHGAWFVAS